MSFTWTWTHYQRTWTSVSQTPGTMIYVVLRLGTILSTHFGICNSLGDKATVWCRLERTWRLKTPMMQFNAVDARAREHSSSMRHSDATRVRVKEQVSEQREWVIECNLRQWPAENVHLYCLLLVRTTSTGAVFERAAVAQPEIKGIVKWCSRKALIQSPNVCTAADADNTRMPKRLRAHQRLHLLCKDTSQQSACAIKR